MKRNYLPIIALFATLYYYKSNAQNNTVYVQQPCSPTLPLNFNNDFESENTVSTLNNCGDTVCNLSNNWSNLINGNVDNIDWRINKGDTPTGETGPSVDSNLGTIDGKYAYLESSSCSNQIAILETECIELDVDYNFELRYHMYGEDTGSLHVDLFSLGVWITDVIAPITSVIKGIAGSYYL